MGGVAIYSPPTMIYEGDFLLYHHSSSTFEKELWKLFGNGILETGCPLLINHLFPFNTLTLTQ